MIISSDVYSKVFLLPFSIISVLIEVEHPRPKLRTEQVQGAFFSLIRLMQYTLQNAELLDS